MSEFILSGFSDEIDSLLDVQLDVSKRLNIQYIEMRNVNGKNIINYKPHEVSEIKKKLDDQGIKLSAIGSPIGKISITDSFEPHLDKFKDALEIAVATNAPYIRMFSFYIPKGDDPIVYRDEVLDRWNKFIEASHGYDVILLHENEKGIYGDTAQRCFDLLNSLNSPKVAAIFDPANFVQCDTETFPHAYTILKDYIKYFHIKDAIKYTGEVVPSGLGDGKLQDILASAKKSGFSGFLSIEPHLSSYDENSYDLKSIEGTLLPSGRQLKYQIAVDSLRKTLNKI